MSDNNEPWPELTPEQLEELKAQIADIEDKTRYVINSTTFGDTAKLLYIAENDCYRHVFRERDDRQVAAADVAVFKRRDAAEAMRQWLIGRDGSKGRSDHYEVLECRLTEDETYIDQTSLFPDRPPSA